jgi:alkanesulfonate monooxygenase SsuD/methylene tetrahydromethanopterin reductase-like flavin-dependent oxidoreductase (luciferase family)
LRFGAHLPLMDFGGTRYDLDALVEYTRAAADNGFDAISVNDHMVFSAPWLDGLTALAAVLPHTSAMTLATTVALPVVRGPVPFAKSISALDRLSGGGRLVVGVGPGSSAADYDAVGVSFDERWPRFDESLLALRALLDRDASPFSGRFYSTEGVVLRPPPLTSGGPPIWAASWGSPAGMRRVARAADGWMASAYNTTPADFADAWQSLRGHLAASGRPAGDFPNALVTMWFHITEDRSEAERVLTERVLPVVKRPEAVLRERLPIGPADEFAERLDAFARAGVQRVFLWPVADEVRQLERFANEVVPRLEA